MGDKSKETERFESERRWRILRNATCRCNDRGCDELIEIRVNKVWTLLNCLCVIQLFVTKVLTTIMAN